MNGSIFDKITAEYYNLTASEKKTADYVLSHRTEVQFMSISELAEASGVADASVSRFCRKLECSGYNIFKLAVANAVAGTGLELSPLTGDVTKEDSFSDVCNKLLTADTEAMHRTMDMISHENISRAADIIEAAGKVLCMGQGGSMVLALEAENLFYPINGKFFSVQGSHAQAMAACMMQPGDALLYFSYSGATKDMLDTLKLANKNGAKTILITHFPKSPGAVLADVVLRCGANESPLQLGSVAAKVAQLFLLDVLFAELCRRDMKNAVENKTKIAAALANKHI